MPILYYDILYYSKSLSIILVEDSDTGIRAAEERTLEHCNQAGSWKNAERLQNARLVASEAAAGS